MSRFLLQKKKLLEEVFEKASSETTEQSFSGILKSLERNLLDDFRINLSYRSFETYYKAIVINGGDYNIRPAILDDLSKYLGFDNFRNYCSDWKTIEYTISETISKIVINITNKPIFQMPEFLKTNGLGIMEMTFLICLITGSVFFSNTNKNGQINTATFGFLGKSEPVKEKECMYWDKYQYKMAYCDDKDPLKDLKPLDTVALKYFKMITRKDTLTVENAYKKVWYSKHAGNVEFFTMDGKDPENGKDLRFATEYMTKTHGGK